MSLRILAYFLPQFHECPYNSEWWGQGFTEWDNVRKARPLRKDHHQPRVPSEGEFDLLSVSEMERQFSQARSAGIDAFVFYHYWYNGDRPLGRPFDLLLDSPEADIRFSLCWANHSWTRTWRNRRGSLDVLIEQTYGQNMAEREKHYAYLARAFADHRYTKIDNSPFFQIYIPEEVDNLSRYCDELRNFCIRENGIAPHIAGTVRKGSANLDYLGAFDSVTLAQPTLGLFGPDDVFAQRPIEPTFWLQLRSKLLDLPLPLRRIIYSIQDLLPKKPAWHDYDQVWQHILTQSRHAVDAAPKPLNLTGFVDFDNTPRYKKSARVMDGFSPNKFEGYMRDLSQLACKTENQLLLINAWNEWGEGMHLQGDTLWPTQRLDAVRRVSNAG
ncbi:glycoside hydrolase family 99-like domain-containing protein [Loktanella agnita]|uniref:glycosyltransferase WbsX family protein n=1 Tax=Loktanella agnita TaxID=287097 RepID=UPI0039894A33